MEPQKKLIFDDLKRGIYCRIKPSPVHGVGVFAIRDIPKGTNPFAYMPGQTEEEEKENIMIPKAEIDDNQELSDEIKKYVKDMVPVENGNYYYPVMSLNQLDLPYYVNHSDKPNLFSPDDGVTFIANRDIKKDEELFVDYSTYSEE